MLIRFGDLNWMGVETSFVEDPRLMLVMGSREQHGYLSMTTGVKIPHVIADAAAKCTGVLVAPPLSFGVSVVRRYPGTVSRELSAFLKLVEDLVCDLFGCGFSGLLVINRHGGNSPAETLPDELARELPGCRPCWYAWW